MNTEVKALIDQVGREWAELKAQLSGQFADEVKKYGAPLGDTNAKVDMINERLNQLEIKLQRPALQAKAGGIEVPEEIASTPEQRKAFGQFLRKGFDALNGEQRKLVEEVKAMTVVDDTQGGFGAPAEFSAEIIKGVIEISPVRGIVTVRNTGSRSIKVMKRTGTFAAQWVGGGGTATRTETTGLAYGMEEIPTHELYAMVDVARQDLEDVQFDLEGELRGEFAEQFALAEATAFLTGNGAGQPEGLMSNSAVSSDVSGSAAAITYDGLVNVSHNIKGPYAAAGQFIFNLKTLGAIRKLKDQNDLPIWAPMAAGAPASVLGSPYTILQGMADVAADAYPVAFGDFKKAYRVADRVTVQIERDPYTQAAVGAVRFWARKRLGGQVVLVEAFRKLQCHT